MTTPEVVMMPLGDLEPAPRNPRTHSEAQLRKLLRSIERYGWTNPVLIRGHRILAGHGRVEAAKRLGLAEVPCIRLEHLTEQQAREYLLADNRLAEDAGWDRDLLSVELLELKALGSDLKLVGFDDAELKKYAGASASESGGGGMDVPALSYRIIVECRDEDEQRHLLDRFEREGLPCRALMI